MQRSRIIDHSAVTLRSAPKARVSKGGRTLGGCFHPSRRERDFVALALRMTFVLAARAPDYPSVGRALTACNAGSSSSEIRRMLASAVESGMPTQWVRMRR